MPRLGRDLEILVAAIERALGPAARVDSPYRMKDPDTGQSREIDVAVISKASGALLAIMECRDRGGVQDTRWIEELVGRRLSLKAPKAVAVSSNGFTRPAIEKAKALGVDLRLARNLTEAEIKKLFGPLTMEITHQRSTLRSVEIFFEDPNDTYSNHPTMKQLLSGPQETIPVVYLPTQAKSTIALVWKEVARTHTALKEVPLDGRKVSISARANFHDPQKRFALTIDGTNVPILCFVFHAECWHEIEENAFQAGIDYGAPSTGLSTAGLASAFKTDIAFEGRPISVTLVLPKQGTAGEISFAPKELGRNEPCHCGSGRKYKTCHGKR